MALSNVLKQVMVKAKVFALLVLHLMQAFKGLHIHTGRKRGIFFQTEREKLSLITSNTWTKQKQCKSLLALQLRVESRGNYIEENEFGQFHQTMKVKSKSLLFTDQKDSWLFHLPAHLCR